MCRLHDGDFGKLCNECRYLISRYTHYVTKTTGTRDDALLEKVNDMCAKNKSLHKWVPDIYLAVHTPVVSVDCVQCANPFGRVLTEKSCPTCVAMEKNYRAQVTQAKKKGSVGEAMAALEYQYRSRLLAGRHVPMLYRRRYNGELPITNER